MYYIAASASLPCTTISSACSSITCACRNITDVDDKIIARAKEGGEDPSELASRCVGFADSQNVKLSMQTCPDQEL